MTAPVTILREAREKLGITADEVERILRLPAGSLVHIEAGSEPLETSLLDHLSEHYGIRSADVAEGLSPIESLEPIRVLLKASAPDLSSQVRSEIAAIAAARRELIELERETGAPNRYALLRQRFMHEGVYGSEGEHWREGRDLAKRFREDTELRGPVRSVRDLIVQLNIELVSAQLSDRRIAGFSLSDPAYGPAIFLNSRGANANPWVRRATAAHELCHVLHDEREHKELTPVQFYADSSDPMKSLGAEPRANAFAAHLLAPDDLFLERYLELKRTRKIEGVVRGLMEHFGISFMMARYRLEHSCQVPHGELWAVSGVPVAPNLSDDVFTAETNWDDDYFPCPTVPTERRGRFVRLVVRAWRSGLLGRGAALEILRAAPDEPLEVLLDLG